MTTSELRKSLYNFLFKQGVYVCHEVTVPKDARAAMALAKSRGTIPIFEGRVDMLSYQKNYREDFGIFRAYELKISVEDFKSIHGHNFDFDFNYYVLPSFELYEKVKHLIPSFVGCLIYRSTNPNAEELAAKGYRKAYIKLNANRSFFDCVKKPKKQKLCCDYAKMLHNFVCALARENCRYQLGYYKAR